MLTKRLLPLLVLLGSLFFPQFVDAQPEPSDSKYAYYRGPFTATEKAILVASARIDTNSAKGTPELEAAEKVVARASRVGDDDIEMFRFIVKTCGKYIVRKYLRDFPANDAIPFHPDYEEFIIANRLDPVIGSASLLLIRRNSSQRLFDMLLADLLTPGIMADLEPFVSRMRAISALLRFDVPDKEKRLLPLIADPGGGHLLVQHYVKVAYQDAEPYLFNLVSTFPIENKVDQIIIAGRFPSQRIHNALEERFIANAMSPRFLQFPALFNDMAASVAAGGPRIQLTEKVTSAAFLNSLSEERRARWVERLAERDRNVKLLNDPFQGPAYIAGDDQDNATLQWLLKHGGAANGRPELWALEGTPLAVAAWSIAYLNTLTLLSAGADPNRLTGRGESPLGLAAGQIYRSNRQLDLIAAFKAAGANMSVEDRKDRGGWTPLHKAVNAKNLPAVKALIDAGANINAYAYDRVLRDKKLLTPTQDAIDEKVPEIEAYLRTKGGNTSFQLTALRAAHKVDQAVRGAIIGPFIGPSH